MSRTDEDLVGFVQDVGDTVIGAKPADVDHFTLGAVEGAVRTSRKSGVTGDLPGGVNPARYSTGEV